MQKDELIGFWGIGADDSSGSAGIWGWGIEFLEDGKGASHSWHLNMPAENSVLKINWVRKGEKVISIQIDDGNDEDDYWDDIEYEITVYDRVWFHLVEKGKKEFWVSPEPLYKAVADPTP